jgi:gliding motility-associated-like protein
MRNFLFFFLLFFCGAVHAQLIIDNVPPGPKIQNTPEYLAKNPLVIPNSPDPQTVFPFNVIYNKKAANATIYNDQAAKWQTNLNPGNLGLGSNEYGVLLTTGQTTVAFGPNNKSDASVLTAIPAPPTFDDADLKILANGYDVKNVSILEFDFVANGYSLSFDYVFCSEEYTEYSISTYNDAFGFFLSGPGIAGGKGFTNNAVNLALLPTTDTGIFDVTINNVNQIKNSNYFVSNGEGTTPVLNSYTQYDGFTKLLNAKYVGLTCGQTYHIKLAIGNVSDNSYDSAVFLKSFEVPPVKPCYNGVEGAVNVCYGEPALITMCGDYPPDAAFRWFKDGVEIVGETKSTIVVKTDGQYCAEVKPNVSSSCILSYECIDITYLPEVPIVSPVSSSVCTSLPPPYNPAFVFNINQTASMLQNVNPSDFDVIYYDSSYQDAYDGVLNGRCTVANGKFPNYSLTTASQTIWVRIEALYGQACVIVEQFNLDAFQYPIVPTASVTVQPTCDVPTGTIVVTSPLGAEYEYSIDAGPYQPSPTFSGLAQNKTYTITSKNINTGCVSAASSPVTVNGIPGAPSNAVGTITQPSCITPTGTITITSPLGANYTYSIDGGAFDTTTTFSGLAPNATYNITVKDGTTGCVSSPTPFVINPLPSNPNAPTASVTVQPTCTTPTGTIVITAPLGANFVYSNNKGLEQSSTVFSGLAAGSTNNIEVKDMVTGCVSAPTTIIINAVPGLPPTPTTSVVQPTCTINTGSITVISPLGANFEYSKDGVSYQTSTAFTGLTAGTSYNITVKEIATGCVSLPNNVTIDTPLNVPNAPTATVTAQPTCIVPTGTITVTAPLGANFEYSIDGVNYVASSTFSNLNPNTTYNVTVRDISSGCTSSATSLFVNAIPANPNAPIGAITHPTCIVTTGTITISSPIGSSLVYNNNNGPDQSSTIFSGLAPGSTNNIVVKDINTGCISTTSTFSINAIPLNPPTPTTTVVQPDCFSNTGTITVTSPLGAIYEYGIDNTYQTGNVFSNVGAGNNYSIDVKETATGCVSNAIVVFINPALNVPTAPIASVTVQPTCIVPTGTINVSSPIGPNLEYSIDGNTYQTSTTFSNLTPNITYNITAKDIISGCVSPITAVFVNPIPASPSSPVGTITQPNCYVPTGTITITAPLGANLEYSKDNGVSYQTSTIFSGLTPNTVVTITVKDVNTGCISLATIFTINSIPADPNAPIGTITQPTCSVQVGRIDITSPLGADLKYSKDNGNTYQTSPSFTNLPPNSVYSIIVMNDVTGCKSIPTSFTIDPVPSIPATPVASVDDSSPCENSTFNLSTPTVAGATYSWSGPNGFTSSIQNPSVTDATLSMSGDYSVVIAIISDCPSLPGIVNVSVKPLPNPSLEDGFVCVDSQTNTVTSTYTLDSGLSNSSYSFEWYNVTSGVPEIIPSEISSTYVVNAPGTYGVVATNLTTSCVSEMPIAKVVASSPPKTMEIVTSAYFSSNQTITVYAEPDGDYEYQIDNGYFQESNIFKNVSPGNHKIVVKDKEGCGELVGYAEIIDAPKFFTPNGDGYNDKWNIFSLKDQPKVKISIFDRYGKLLILITPYGAGWDGTYNGENLPSSDYWFLVEYTENGINKTFKSHFTLKR